MPRDIVLICRPLVLSGPTPATRRKSAPFRTNWQRTVDLLAAEVHHLGGETVTLLLDVPDRDIRADGWLRADARPRTPAVIACIDSRHGPLRLSCDRFVYWQDNVRAIALGLEALRKVDRYGITRDGEQYRGMRALPAPGTSLTEAAARAVLAELAGADVGMVTPATLEHTFRVAAKRWHPDMAEGDRAQYARAEAARDVLRIAWAGRAA